MQIVIYNQKYLIVMKNIENKDTQHFFLNFLNLTNYFYKTHYLIFIFVYLRTIN